MTKAIIIDDEAGAYINLSNLLATYCPNINIIGYASDTADAEKLIADLQPELVFLDIQMPRETGIEFIKRIWPINFEVIFVTAYDEFALKVFKLNALDYILKPINISYLQASMHRAGMLIKSKQSNLQFVDERFVNLNPSSEIDSLVIKNRTDIKRFRFNQITHLQASGSYTNFYFRGEHSLASAYNLSHYEEILPEKLFIRTHRSYLVNIEYIKHITNKEQKPYCTLINDTQVPISRRRLSAIKSIL